MEFFRDRREGITADQTLRNASLGGGKPVCRPQGRGRVGGLEYRLEIRALDELDFFSATFNGTTLTVAC